MLLGLMLLITVGCIWTFTGISMGGSARHGVSTGVLQLVSCLALCVLYAVMIRLGIYPKITVSTSQALWALGVYLAVGALGYALNETMARAMERGPNGMVWGILQSGMLIPFVFGILCHGVAAPVSRLVGMVLLLFAVLLMAQSEQDKEKKVSGKSWLVLSFIAFGICGIQQTLSNEPSYDMAVRDGVPVVYRCLAVGFGNFLLPLGAQLLRGPRVLGRNLAENFRLKWFWGYMVLTVILSVVTSLFLQFKAMDMMAAVGMGAISYPVMVVSCIAGFSVYSFLFLKERLNLRSGLGLAFCIGGIVLVSLEPRTKANAQPEGVAEQMVETLQENIAK